MLRYIPNLAAIRAAAGLTQAEMAARLGMSPRSGQRTVSQIEARDDWLLSSLINYIHAAGAEATLIVSLDGEDVEIPLIRG